MTAPGPGSERSSVSGPALGPDLGPELAGLLLPTPVLTAAGCGGTGRELEGHLDLTALGAFTTRTITRDPSPGSPPPRLAETAAGMLSETGRHNPGLQGFLATELPWLAQRQVRTVVSIAGATVGEYAELARRLGTSPGVCALEVNLVSANRDAYQRRFCDDAFGVAKVVGAVRGELPRGIPVLAKLAPGPALVELARAASRNGADAVVLVHGFPGVTFDPGTWRPSLGAGTGTVGGPAVLAQTLRCVWDVHRAMPELPVVGAGGVRSGFDVVQMLLAGATAVQVGTALLREPTAVRRITEELAAELVRHDIKRPADLVGAGHPDPGRDTT